MAPSEQPKPGIYRGWPVAGVTFLTLAASIGMGQFAFGVFITPLEDEFGWTRTQINISLTLGVVTAFISPFTGRLLDRYGSRWIMVISLASIALGFFLRAIMTDLWQFYLFSLLIVLGVPGTTMMPVGRLVGLWFPGTRGRMMGIVTAGNNFGGMVTIPLAAGMIALAGWRWSFAAMGLIVLVVLVLVVLTIRDDPDEIDREAGKRWAPKTLPGRQARSLLSGFSTSQAFHMRTFWFLMIAMGLQQFARTAVSTQLFPHLEQKGFGIGTAAAMVSVVSFFAIASKIISGRVSESFTARYTYVAIIAMQMVGMALLILFGGSWAVWIALVIFGLGMGGVGTLGPLVIVENFGLRNFGGILGLTRPAQILPEIAGPLLAGITFDVTDQYDLAFGIVIAILGVSIVSFLLARPVDPNAATDTDLR
ncbi:MAG: MFS transporter [Chloroflexi bacterium]|nr:MFS transporter [Chloroflexota bacterium]